MRRFDAAAQPLGPEMVVADQLGGAPSVAVAPDGSFLIAWQSGNDIVGQRFDAAGVPQGAEFTLTDPMEIGEHPSVAAVGDSQFVVVWENYNTCEARGRPVGSIGTGEAFSVPDGGHEEKLSGVAGNTAGLYQIVWYSEYALQIRAQQFTGATALTGPFAVTSVTDPGSADPGARICAREGKNSFVVVWSDLIDEVCDRKVKYREVGPGGGTLNPTVDATPEVSQASAPLQILPDVACGSDDSLIVTWYDWTVMKEDRGRVFHNGTSSDFTIGFVNPDAAEPLSPAFLKSGDPIVAWSDCPPGLFTGCRVFGQQFTLSGAGDCPGDCNRDGQVTIDELVLAVNIALASPDAPLMKQCLPADTNLDYRVTIDELVLAVNRALGSCS